MNRCLCRNQTLVIIAISALLNPVVILTGYAQTLDPQRIFRKDIIADNKIVTVYFSIPGEEGTGKTEVYIFDKEGNYTGFIKQSGSTSDTQYVRIIENNRIHAVTEKSHNKMLIINMLYNKEGRLESKSKSLNDTLFSKVHYLYDSVGMLIKSIEITTEGDTIAEAFYLYDQGILVRTEYTGMRFSRIEYVRSGNRLISRVFEIDGTLLMTKTEHYNRFGLLNRETVSVTGIKAVPTTKYRYRNGLLQRVRQPDGLVIKIRYTKSHT